LQTNNKWIDNHRAYFTTRLYGDFYALFSSFQSIYYHFLDNHQPSYDAINQLVGSEHGKNSLWRLKDLSHQLWRQADAGDLEGCLLDWVIGSLFHEAMKLKENIYLRENYRPLMESNNLPPRKKPNFCGFECKRFMAKTATEIDSQMENIGFLFGQANYLLRVLLLNQTTNRLLLRFLAEHEHVAFDLWYESITDIFTDLFDNNPAGGYCMAAASFVEGHWFARAINTYQKALQLDPHCFEAIQQIPQLKILQSHQDSTGG